MKKFIITTIILLCTLHNLHAQKAARIAVLDFQSNGVPTFIGRAISDIIITEFKKYNDFAVIERNQIELILKEQAFQKEESADPAYAAEYGKLLAADRIIIGSVSKLGNIFTITAKIINVKEGEIEYAESENCYIMDDIDKATQYVAIKILNKTSKKQYHLPNRDYKTRKKNKIPIEISINTRYGYQWGVPVPIVDIPASYPDKIRIGSHKKNLEILEITLSPKFYFNDFIAIKGLFTYSHILESDGLFRIDEEEDHGAIENLPSADYCYTHTGTSRFTPYGLGAGIGLQLEYKFNNFIPFIAFNTQYMYYKLNNSNRKTFSIYGNTPPDGDFQDYYMEISNSTSLLQGEIEAGFMAYLTKNVGLTFSFIVRKTLYGNYFNDFKLTLKDEDTDNNFLPKEYKDLDKTMDTDSFSKKMPLTYFIQVGVFYRL